MGIFPPNSKKNIKIEIKGKGKERIRKVTDLLFTLHLLDIKTPKPIGPIFFVASRMTWLMDRRKFNIFAWKKALTFIIFEEKNPTKIVYVL